VIVQCLPDSEEGRVEIWTGFDEIMRKSVAVMNGISLCYDLCLDYSGAAVILAQPEIKKAYLDMKQRKIPIRIVTEVNKENLEKVKELAAIGEIRHFDQITGNFVIADKSKYAGSPETKNDTLLRLISCNIAPFVQQQQYFFEMLWNKAIPVDSRIGELELGIKPEVTEVWKDQNIILSRSLEILRKLEWKYDFCIDWRGPSIIMTIEFIKNAYHDIVARGGKLRLITEIVPSNIEYCKDMLEFMELRHLDNIKGNFGIVDEKIYGGTATTQEKKQPMSYLHSTVADFVKQQQYFFETLWEKALPATQRIKEIEEGIEPEITEIIAGWENITAKLQRGFKRAVKQVCSCMDSMTPEMMIRNGFEKLGNEFVEKGGHIRVLTEITPENLPFVKQLMETHEIRHLDGVRANFGISEKDYSAPASVDVASGTIQMLFSNSKEIIKQHQYLFEMMWNKAIPATQRIKEIEEGVEREATEIIDGADDFVKVTLRCYQRESKEINVCGDSTAPSSIVVNTPVLNAAKDFVARGGRIRLVTEITPGNIEYCRELMKTSEIKHLDGIRGNFGVSSKDYLGYIISSEGQPTSQIIHSTSKKIIDEQNYLFTTLWTKAIPSEERIKQLKEGVEPGRIEVIPDTQKSLARAFEIMKRTKKELVVLFATGRTYSLAMTRESLQYYQEMTRSGVKVRILVPKSDEIELLHSITRAKEMGPGVDLRVSNAGLNTRITILVSDGKEFMTWELVDDTLSDPYLAGGVATYSNIESIATSYGTIFENLWILTEFAESLRVANIKLENNEKAMREFINIAAHELRTPIQPILGLSEVLQNPKTPLDQKSLVEVILRNAHRLQRLADDILDVTRIESGKLKLVKGTVDLDTLVENVVKDFQRSTGDRVTITILREQIPPTLQGDGSGTHMQLHQRDSLVVHADYERLVQVLSNLISNAIKFTPDKGTIGIRVIAPAKEETLVEPKEAAVIISDEGPGIDSEILPRLFERFISKSDKGTGLGLYLSKKIIEAHGGRIWAENNKDNRGATFSFALPLKN